MASLDYNNDSEYKYYSKLIEKYKDMAYTIALKITRNEQDSEEIVQDSFVKMFQGLNKFKNESKFSTWFYRIVYNTSISALRNKRIKTVDIESVHFDKSLIYTLNNTIQNLN
jgi:RNA polymerase sigma-70 factor (ECF subfamily)